MNIELDSCAHSIIARLTSAYGVPTNLAPCISTLVIQSAYCALTQAKAGDTPYEEIFSHMASVSLTVAMDLLFLCGKKLPTTSAHDRAAFAADAIQTLSSDTVGVLRAGIATPKLEPEECEGDLVRALREAGFDVQIINLPSVSSEGEGPTQ